MDKTTGDAMLFQLRGNPGSRRDLRRINHDLLITDFSHTLVERAQHFQIPVLFTFPEFRAEQVQGQVSDPPEPLLKSTQFADVGLWRDLSETCEHFIPKGAAT